MNKDEELKTRYYNLIEEEEKIQRFANELALERAEEKGIQEGISIGIKKNQKEVIFNMLNKNMSIDTIAEIVNLTIKEVEYIIKEIQNKES